MDALSDHPNQIDKSPYAYAWNNPVNLTDPDGNCPTCPIIAWQAVRYVGTAILAGAVTYTVVKGYKDFRSRQTSVQDNTSVDLDLKNRPGLLKTEDKSESKDEKSTKKENKVKPNSDADGDHSTLKRSEDGEITNTATYKKNPQNPSGFDEEKRVDVKGKSHFDKKTGKEIPTPHVHEKGTVRPAKPEELPKKTN